MRVNGLLAGLTALSMFSVPVSALAGDITVPSLAIPSSFELDATLEAISAGTISAQTSGVIRSVHGDVNDRVNSGDLLIEIDDTQQRAAVSQAEAALAQAKALNDDAQTLLKRNSRLQKQGTLSEGEYDRTVAQAKSTAANVEAAQAALTQAREQLSYTRVTAPYAGVITQRFTEVGELVNPGQPLMSGYASNALRAVSDLPQRIAAQYRDSSQLTIVTADGDITPASATLYPFADPERHSVRLRASVPEQQSSGLIPGQWVKIRMQTGERQGIAVPATAVLRRGELTGVYVRTGEKFALRQIRLGNAFALNGQEMIEVLAGLSEGDVISDNALNSLANTAEAGE